MIFGEYFPNPAIFNQYRDNGYFLISPIGACAIEAFGTFILVFIIFVLTDENNDLYQKNRTLAAMGPYFIGFTVSTLISLFSPLTQAGWNPARDFGPRLVALIIGYKSIAIPGPRNGFWVYIVGPIIGGLFGGFLYNFTIGKSILVNTKNKKKFKPCEPVGTISLLLNDQEESEGKCLIVREGGK